MNAGDDSQRGKGYAQNPAQQKTNCQTQFSPNPSKQACTPADTPGQPPCLQPHNDPATITSATTTPSHDDTSHNEASRHATSLVLLAGAVVAGVRLGPFSIVGTFPIPIQPFRQPFHACFQPHAASPSPFPKPMQSFRSILQPHAAILSPFSNPMQLFQAHPPTPCSHAVPM